MSSSCNLFGDAADDIIDATEGQSTRENTLPEAERLSLVNEMLPRAPIEAALFCRRIGKPELADDFDGEAQLAILIASRHWHADRGTWPTFCVSVIRNYLRRYAQLCEAATYLEDWGGVSGPPAALEDDEGDDGENETARAVRKPNGYQLYLLSLLPEDNRAIVRAVSFDGFTPAEVADQTGRTVKDVKLIIRNSFTTFVKELEKEETEDLFSSHPDADDYSDYEEPTP
jgi:DNA-directed RNA polymerase specialized sigma24 family protein